MGEHWHHCPSSNLWIAPNKILDAMVVSWITPLSTGRAWLWQLSRHILTPQGMVHARLLSQRPSQEEASLVTRTSAVKASSWMQSPMLVLCQWQLKLTSQPSSTTTLVFSLALVAQV